MRSLFIVLLVVFSSFLFASTPPTLTGTVRISITDGTIDADLNLSNIPKIKDYEILLNSGLNVEYFRNTTAKVNYAFKKTYNPEKSYESFGYYFPDNTGKSKFLPRSLQLKYTGKFSVIASLDTASEHGDWKGNIAFNGKTIRADGLQSTWYPVLYDITNDKKLYKLLHDIEIICDDCQSIYLNGSEPISATHGRFKSDTPIELAIFAGEYGFEKKNNSYYLNTGLSKQQITSLSEFTKDLVQFYQNVLSIPYGNDVTYIQTTPISKKNGWLFVSFPSIVSVSHTGGFKNLFNEKKEAQYKPFIAHELAHYYFGTYKQFNAELGSLFNESFSEYLAIVSMRSLQGEKSYFSYIDKKEKELANMRFVTIKDAKITTKFADRNIYLYSYVPIVLLAMEKEIGKKNMFLWLNNVLTAKTDRANYAFLVETLGSVVNDVDKMNELKNTYLENKNSFGNALKVLK